MFVVDSLVTIGLATLSLGTIQEADGIQEHSFWLRNCGSEAVTLVQGYTSCGCTTIAFAKDEAVAPNDSTRVTLRFNPQGKGGEFLETGTIVYGASRKRVEVALEGTCITSEETLMHQFPIRINDDLRLSTNRFDLGRMVVGETKERSLIVLHRGEGNRQEIIPVRFTVDEKTGKGLQHIAYPLTVTDGRKKTESTITLDVFIK